jgi:hypothetical protein
MVKNVVVAAMVGYNIMIHFGIKNLAYYKIIKFQYNKHCPVLCCLCVYRCTAYRGFPQPSLVWFGPTRQENQNSLTVIQVRKLQCDTDEKKLQCDTGEKKLQCDTDGKKLQCDTVRKSLSAVQVKKALVLYR